MNTINYMGAYANMLNMFKSLSSTIKARINLARRTDNLISIDDIRNVLKTLEDMLNNNLCSLDTEVKIEVIDGISQTSPSVPPNNQENKRLNCNRNMNKKHIRLTESDLHKIVRESVNNVLNEIGDTPYGQYMLGRAANRALNYPDGDKTYSNLKKKAKESAFNSGLAPYADGRHTSYFFDGDEDQENFEKQVDMMNKGRGNDVKLNQAKDAIRNNASRYYDKSGLGKKEAPTPTVSSNAAAAKMRQQRMDIRNRYRM